MKKIVFILLIGLLTCNVSAQKKTAVKQRPTQEQKAKPSKKTAKTKAKTTKNAVVYTNASIRGLQGQRSLIQKKIKEQEQALRKNQADVKERLNTLLTLNSQIDERQKNINGIESDINHINGNINILKAQLQTLEQQLQDRRTKYIKSMRYLAHNRTVQDKLMFIFSAKTFTQMYRRLRFVREYADFQKAQGQMVQLKQAQVDGKHKQLQQVKGQKSNLLYKGKKEKEALEGQQDEQKKVVASLQNQQKTIQKIITEQRQKDAALNAQIDRLVAQEVAKARARAAEEAKRQAAAKAAAQRRAAELAKKKAAAEAAAREKPKRLQERLKRLDRHSKLPMKPRRKLPQKLLQGLQRRRKNVQNRLQERRKHSAKQLKERQRLRLIDKRRNSRRSRNRLMTPNTYLPLTA